MTPDWAAKPIAVPYANFGNPQSLNLYSYVENNPTTLGDPDGQGMLRPGKKQHIGVWHGFSEFAEMFSRLSGGERNLLRVIAIRGRQRYMQTAMV